MAFEGEAEVTSLLPPRSYAGDPLVSWLFRRKHFRPYHLGLITLSLGFGTLASWYAIMLYVDDPATRFNGLFHFYAASYGDACFLPLISLVIALAYQNSVQMFRDVSIAQEERIRRLYARPLWVILTVAVAGVGILFAYVLLPGSAYQPSWTSPAYGRLNAVGWYHAFFMFAQFYLILGFLIRQSLTLYVGWRNHHIVERRGQAWERNTRATIGFSVLLGGFSGLLATDDVYIRHPEPTWAQVLSIPARHPAILGTYLFCLPLSVLSIMLIHRRGTSRSLTRIPLVSLALLIEPVGIPVTIFILREVTGWTGAT